MKWFGKQAARLVKGVSRREALRLAGSIVGALLAPASLAKASEAAHGAGRGEPDGHQTGNEFPITGGLHPPVFQVVRDQEGEVLALAVTALNYSWRLSDGR